MANGADILLALVGLIVALEIVLYTLRGALLRILQTERLDRQIDAVQGELRHALERTQKQKAELLAARDALQAAVTLAREAQHDLENRHVPGEILVHRLGETGAGTLYRASVHKTLPANTDESQARLWAYENFVDVWAPNPQQAHEIATRHFAAKAGYVLGEFAPPARRAIARSSPAETDTARKAAA